MAKRILNSGIFCLVLVFSGQGLALAECPSVNFDNDAVGLIITTQYEGVTFSAQPQSCGGDPVIHLKVAIPASGGTSSGTHALGIDTGCPDFSPDYIRMVFDDLQNLVTFTVGEMTGASGYVFTIRYYSNAGGLLGSFNVTSSTGIHRLVTVGSAGGSKNIRRIEVDSTIDAFEMIDDLIFNSDSTPPIAQISVPAYEACACGTIQIRGQACDPDGEYDSDQLEYRRVDAAVGDPWTLAGSATTPACGENQILYNWSTAARTHGLYYLRLTVANVCGLTASAVTVAYVDKQFDTVVIRYPAVNAVVGGAVCIDGTVWDDHCFDQYTVKYKTAVGGVFQPVDPASPVYSTFILNDPLGFWNTTALADGDYIIQVQGTDSCSNTKTVTQDVTVDNTPPTALIADPTGCTYQQGTVKVVGTADDDHLEGWVLQYTGGSAHGWVTIASGNTAVSNDVLGAWDTSALDTCAYTLRLVVTDEAILGCQSGDYNISEYKTSVYVGYAGDLNADGAVNLEDFAIMSHNWLEGT
jgi:hypothetical protein